MGEGEEDKGQPCGAEKEPLPPTLQEDVDFLLLRAMSAGSVSFTANRWTGQSSNALVSVAYGGAQDAFPYDRSDYAACVRTFKRLPSHRKTLAVRTALRAARDHYLSRYPEDRSAAQRAEKRREYEKRAEAEQKRRQRNWKRRISRAAREHSSPPAKLREDQNNLPPRKSKGG